MSLGHEFAVSAGSRPLLYAAVRRKAYMSQAPQYRIARAHLWAISSRVYGNAPFLTSARQRLRLHVCPYEQLISCVPEHASVLDVGCGAGLFLLLLAHTRGLTSATGFDSNSRAVAEARRAATRLKDLPETGGVSLRFEHQAIDEPWPRGLFDVVSLIDVMHHVPQAQRHHLLEQMRAHVRPGGLVLYKDMCRRPAWRALANRFHDLAFAGQWVRYEPIGRIDEWARGWGARVRCALTLSRLWYGHELRVFEAPTS